jgi:hypothetical protein
VAWFRGGAVPGNPPVPVAKNFIHGVAVPISFHVPCLPHTPSASHTPTRKLTMPRHLRLFAVSIALLGSLNGCSVMPAPDPADVMGQPKAGVAVSGVTLDESTIPTAEAVRQQLDPLLSDVSEPLTPAECACLAASQCSTASALEREAAHMRRQASLHGRHASSNLLPPILEDQASKQRNDAAEQALVAYYQLAEVQLQQELLVESYRVHQQTEETVDGLIEAGIAIDVDRTDLDRQRYALDKSGLQLGYDQVRAIGQLKSLIGADPVSTDVIRATCSVEPRGPEFGLHEAIEIGHANDVQLRALRRFLEQGDVDDLGVARSLLKTANPMMGQEPASLGFLAKIATICGRDERGDQELSVRRRQVQELHDARTQQVDLEVANAVLHAQQCYYHVGVARDMLASRESREAFVESNREAQKSGYQELVAARSERLKARSELLHALVELEIAHVRVKARLGLLGQECAALIRESGVASPARRVRHCR